MRYERTERFIGDWKRLSREEQDMFLRSVREDFIPALERKAGDPAEPWPRRLRVKAVASAPGIWELTWSFSGPDGRATWQWIEAEGEAAILWRRIGGHAIFRQP